MGTHLYLRDDAKIEPLIARWHAHPLLVSPPAAAFMTRHHVALMESFTARPELHRRALAQPQLRGGPFLDSHSPAEVAGLLARTLATHAELLELAAELERLFEDLQTTEGFSLEPRYAELGDQLRGRLELVYEASGKARFRLFEPLFYAAHPPEAHQELAVSVIASDERPFLMSTPRLEDSGDLFLPLAFGSESARTLLRAREHPVSPAQIDEWCELQSGEHRRSPADVEALFTREPPITPTRPPPSPTQPRIHYIGHACVLVATGHANVLIDPLVPYRIAAAPRFTLRDLPEILDCAAVTHAHYDHYAIETLLQIRERTRTLVVPRANPGHILDPSLELMSRRFGFTDVVGLQPFEALELERCRLRALPFLGEHGDLDVQTKLGYVLELEHRSIGFLADSKNVDPALYEHVRELYGPVDTVFIGLECEGAPVSWAYGPLLFGSVSRSMDHSRRTGGSDAGRALALIEALGCRRVYVYAMALEPWMAMFGGASCDPSSVQAREIKILLAECAARGIEAELLDGPRVLPA